MINNEIKFEYSLEGTGWAKITFDISGKKFEYQASYTCCTLDQILGMAEDVLESPPKEGFNSRFFIIDEEWRKVEVHFLFEVGQNRIAEIKIIEKAEGKDSIEQTVYKGTIDYFQFVRQTIASATNILKNYGLIGYSIHWGEDDFPLTSYLKTLDFFDDYHNLDYLTMYENQSKSGYMRTNIYDEIKLLSKYLEPEYPKKDIYYYIYKGSLLELENYLSEDKSEIDKLTDEKNVQYKYTPLICAIKAGMESCALMLIRYGANINLTNNKHTTLHFAVQAHSYSICKKLIEMNKDLVNTPNNSGRTPIFEIISSIKNQTEDGNDFRIFDLLLQNNADLFYMALNKSTPMDMIKTSEEYYKNNLVEYIKTNYSQLILNKKNR